MSSAVFRQYDQATLDREYDNRGKVPLEVLQAYRARWAEGSRKARSTMRCTLDIPYGASPLEKLDVFHPHADGLRPVQIYIHGGYWHFGDKSDCSYVALGFDGLGMVTVTINYGLAPAVQIGEQVRQCAAAVQWVRRHIAAYGGDPEQLYVTGHSAGAHLALMMVAAEAGGGSPLVPPGRLKGICALSGIYDLEPIRAISVNDAVRLEPRDVQRLSPARLACNADAHILVGVGGREGDEYLRQTDVLAAEWSKSAKRLEKKIYPDDDHFSIRTGLNDPSREICQDIRRLLTWNDAGSAGTGRPR